MTDLVFWGVKRSVSLLLFGKEGGVDHLPFGTGLGWVGKKRAATGEGIIVEISESVIKWIDWSLSQPMINWVAKYLSLCLFYGLVVWKTWLRRTEYWGGLIGLFLRL